MPWPEFNWSWSVRADSATRVWLRLEQTGGPAGDDWIEIGMSVERDGRKSPRPKLYFIAVIDGVAVHGVTEPAEERIPDLSWPADLELSIEVLDNGDIVNTFNGDSFTWRCPQLENVKFGTYEIGAEILQSVDQLPGTASEPLRFSDLSVKSLGSWIDTELDSDDFKIYDLRPDGSLWHPAASHEWAFGHVHPRGCQIWDVVVE